MTQTLDPAFRAALRRELVAVPTARPPRFRRRTVIATALAGALTLGGAVAVAELRSPAEVADPPLAAPVVLNGVGPAHVPLPAAPGAARYVMVALTCFDATRCETPGGGVSADTPRTLVDTEALPVTSEVDPANPQQLAPAAGVDVRVAAGTHWRLYAVYAARRDSQAGELDDGRTLGVPGLEPTDLVPAVSTEGRSGWIETRRLDTRGAWLPVYADDGTTVIGQADVSRTVR